MTAEVLRRGRWLSWVGFLVALVLYVSTFVYGAAIWDRIPDRIPLHFGIDGEATRWGEKTFGNVFFPQLVGGAGLFTLPIIAAILPGLMEVPKDASDWTRLRIEASTRGARDGMGWVAAATVALIGWTSLMAWHTAGGVPIWPVGVLLLAIFAGLWLAYVRWRRWGRRLADLHHIHPTPEEEAEEALWLPMGIYNNPEDPRVFPPKREGYGIGTTVNWGRPAGKLFVALILLVVLVPVVLVFLLG
ncbi:DUF1648 domain-containing protein [Ornithinimicrobium sp. Y1694]|uniref:DUF1648 domain-containing protein n=1 Tax=Ornithinimicrobium sp. Y1694 TaxID=3418590 RepID=UPI003CE7C2FD